MLYFKNVELAETYHISLRTVLNWIESTKKGKLDLTLHTQDGKTYVANTSKNIAIIEKLVEAGKKYRNTRGFKVVTPKPEFYKLYDQQQIFDIVSSLDIHREIPRQYNYFDGGANYWDEYSERLAAEKTPNVINSTIKLLAKNQGYIDELLTRYKKINVIDIGVGNALPVKDFLAHLLERNVLGRYVALDISPEMLEIARRNVNKWFGGKIAFEGYELDINYDRFTSIIAGEYLKKDPEDTLNLVLLLGGTLCNMRQPDGAFRVIHDSLGRNELFIHTQKLDTEASRRYFDFNVDPGKSTLAPIHGFTVDLLNIDKSLYDVELGFDNELQQRYSRIRLKVAITIRFEFDEGERLIHLNKGDAVLVWRSWQQSALDVVRQFDSNGFQPLQISQTEDTEYILTVSRIKTER